MIRVLYTAASPKIAGTERSLLMLFDHLGDEVQPVVIIPSGGALEAELIKRNIEYHIVTQRCKFGLLYLWKLFHIYKNSNADILHHHSSRLAAIPAKLLGIKIVERNNMSRDREGFFLNKFTILDRLSAMLIDEIICVSEDLKKKLIERGIPSAKITVIYNGVNFHTFFPVENTRSEARDHLLIGIFGRLHPQKGHEDLWRALQILQGWDVKFQLLVIGQGELEDKLKRLAKSLGIEGSIRFLGYQNNLNPYYNQCDLIIVPSIWEPLPNVILEAMAVGKPIIASNVGGIPEIIKDGENGILIPPRNPASLAEKIKEILQNPQLRHRLEENAFQYARQNLSLDRMMEQTLQLYNKLLA